MKDSKIHINHPYSPEKIYLHKKHLTQLKKERIIKPVTVDVDITDVCDHVCPWCEYSNFRKQKPCVIPWNILNRLLDDLVDSGVRGIIISGSGEPTTYPQFIKLTKKIKKTNILAALFTHGGHLSKYIDQIAKSFKYVRVSIDAGNSSEHKYYHFLESDLFAEILQNIALLKKLNPEIRLCISYLVAEKNYQSIISLANFLESSLTDFLLVKFSRFSSDNIWINEEILSDIDSQIELLQNIVSVYYRRPTLSTSTKNIVNKCRTTYLKALITPDCKLYICNQRRGEKKMSFGSLYEDDFWTIWNSKTHKYVYSQIDTKNCPPCRHVAYNRLFEAVIDTEIPEISQSKNVGELISFL